MIIAKNYLDEKKIKKLERTISGFFDYLENIVENGNILKMKDLAECVDNFLSFNKYEILDNNGKISHTVAKKKAIGEYAEFNKIQRIESDFDKEVIKNMKNIKNN